MTIVIAEPGRLTRAGADIAVYQWGRPQRRITSSARSTGSKPGGQIERSDRFATPDVSPTDRAELPPLNNAVFSVEPEVGPVITEALRERSDGERVWNELDAYGCGRLMWRLASGACTAWQRPIAGTADHRLLTDIAVESGRRDPHTINVPLRREARYEHTEASPWHS